MNRFYNEVIVWAQGLGARAQALTSHYTWLLAHKNELSKELMDDHTAMDQVEFAWFWSFTFNHHTASSPSHSCSLGISSSWDRRGCIMLHAVMYHAIMIWDLKGTLQLLWLYWGRSDEIILVSDAVFVGNRFGSRSWMMSHILFVLEGAHDVTEV